MPIFEIKSKQIVAINQTTFAKAGIRERGDLQRLLRDHIDIISPETLIVSEEYGDWEDSRRRIDLLGVDKQANIVVIELKRTEDGGHMELQALRYAAMTSTMTFGRVVDVFRDYLEAREIDKDAEQELLAFLNWDEANEEAFAQDVRIVLASANFSVELTTAVLWLNDRDLDIRCVRLRPYAYGDQILMDVEQIIPLPEAEEFQTRFRNKAQAERVSRSQRLPWSGVWFVNVGEADDDDCNRSWEQCSKHGFLSAGGGQRYIRAIQRPGIGDKIVAFQKGKGYVGYGVVTSTAIPVEEMQLAIGKSLAEIMPNLDRSKGDCEKTEHAVGIQWDKTVPLDQAKWYRGAFASPNVVCKLHDPKTISFLQKELGLEINN